MKPNSLLPALVVTCIVMVLAVIARTPAMLGAHPFWSTQVILIGAPLGLMLGVILWQARLSRRARLALAFCTLLLTALPAHFGKAVFAASFAEDAFAGQMWHFGWIALIAAFTALLFSALTPRGSDSQP